VDGAIALIEHTVGLIDRTIRVQAGHPGAPTRKSADDDEPSTLEPSDPLADLAASLIGELAAPAGHPPGEFAFAD
jgi:hypothetical protein